jgi:hypothetical protein
VYVCMCVCVCVFSKSQCFCTVPQCRRLVHAHAHTAIKNEFALYMLAASASRVEGNCRHFPNCSGIRS